MNDKPLRHEDYLSMAAENQKLKAKIEKMENKPAKRARLKRMIGRVAMYSCGLAILVVIGFAGFIGAHTIAKHHNNTAAQEKHKRTTTCYFTRRYSGSSDPWVPQKWEIIRSACDGCMNHRVMNAPTSTTYFSSQDEAWAFMMKWHLPACE